MASNYKSLKCDCCAGSLEYSKIKKVWICQYCGNEIRREEEYDGLYTIKNVVKQTLTDIAYGRLDAAQKNLAECEKIDSRYIGTMMARLAFQMYSLTTPGACPQGAVKSLIAQLKRGYEELISLEQGISTEEEALYESFEQNSDVLGVLIVVFDSLGDSIHRDFQEHLLDVSRIYSPALNDNLLRYAMKNKKLELADGILKNVDNLNCKNAMISVLQNYPDSSEKCRHLERLVPKTRLNFDDRKIFEGYLEQSADTYDTKLCAYRCAVEAKASPSIEHVMKYLLTYIQKDSEKTKELIELICKTNPNDMELYYLVDRIFAEHEAKAALAEMEVLKESNIFLAISARNISIMLNRSDWTVEEKCEFFDLLHHWKIDARTHDAVLAEYLQHNQDDSATRLAILEKLISYVTTISTAKLKQYVLVCTTDGAEKLQILELLLQLELNMSFFRELLQEYMKQGLDEPEVKDLVVKRLMDEGMQVDGATLVQMACNATEENMQETISFIQNMRQKGVRISNDALSTYLETVPGNAYHSSLINMLHISSSIISPVAINKYVLYGKEDLVKTKNALVFDEQCSYPFGGTECTIQHLGNRIQCNLMQAYVLLAPDSSTTMYAIVEAMKSARTKLNPEMTVNGMPVKFKKYIVEHKASLSDNTLKVCEENKVFSLFF